MTAAVPGDLPRRTLRLERSPFEPAVLAQLAVAAVALVAIGAAIGLPLADAPAPALDAQLSARATAPVDSGAWSAARLLGRVGHLVIVSVVAAVIALIARRRSGRWDVFWLLATVLGGATVITGVLKVLIDRARPEGADALALSAAYPSGHTVRAAAVFGLVAWVLRYWTRHPVVRRLTIPVAIALVLVNGIARVVLGVHWPSDVLVGLVLGGAWLAVSFRSLRPAPG